MKRLFLLLLLVIYGFVLSAQTSPPWRYTPRLQTDITTVNDYLRINLGVVRLNNPLEAGQVIQARWVNNQLVFHNQAADFERYILQKASPTTFGGVKIDGTTIVMNPQDSVISAVMPQVDPYHLPVASTTTLGGVKVDNQTVIIGEDSVIRANLPPQKLSVDSIFRSVHPTLPIESLQYRKGDFTYGITSMQQPGGLFTGGVVTWVDSLHFVVSPAGYFINGQMYTTEQTALELSPSDATYGRIDLIVLDTLSHVTIIEGTPQENPQKPIINPLAQVEVTQVLILPNATTPGQPDVITDEIVFDENTEWGTSALRVTVDWAATTPVTPFHASHYASVGAIGLEDRLIFTSSQPLTTADFETLSFSIWLKGIVTSRHYLFVEFCLNGQLVSTPLAQSITRNNVSGWQNLITSLATASITSPTFDQVRLRWVTTGNVGDHPGFYLDYMKLQAGVTQPVTQGEVELLGDVTGKGVTSIVTTVVNDSHSHTINTLPTLLSSLDGVVSDGSNIDLVAGNNITIAPDDVNNTITMAVSALDTTDIGGLDQYVTDRIPATHNPVTIDPASAAYASIDGTQQLTITPPSGGSGPNLSVQALSGTTVGWDVSGGINATLTLSGNTTLTLSNLTAGTSGNIVITNPSTYTLTLAGYTNKISPYIISSANTVKTSGSSKTDCFSWYYDGTYLMWNGTLDYN